jgi:hypothetical protein
MKKVTMIHWDIIYRFMEPYTGLSLCGGRHSGGGGGFTEAPWSVKSIVLSKING